MAPPHCIRRISDVQHKEGKSTSRVDVARESGSRMTGHPHVHVPSVQKEFMIVVSNNDRSIRPTGQMWHIRRRNASPIPLETVVATGVVTLAASQLSVLLVYALIQYGGKHELQVTKDESNHVDQLPSYRREVDVLHVLAHLRYLQIIISNTSSTWLPTSASGLSVSTIQDSSDWHSLRQLQSNPARKGGQ